MKPPFIIVWLALLGVFAVTLSLPALPPQKLSSLEAQVGQNGWYTSEVVIRLEQTAEINPSNPLVKLAMSFRRNDIVVRDEGSFEIATPDGNGGSVSTLVRIDKTAPRIFWEMVQEGILGITAEDEISLPARLEVSLDGGQTWQTTEYPIPWAAGQALTPSVTWNVHLNQGLNHLQIRATDQAGNLSQATVEMSNG